MAEIGVRELKTNASEIIRSVREERARYIVTYRGKAVGVLLPIDEAGAPQEATDLETNPAWQELVRLGDEIAHKWSSPHTSTEILSDSRR